nr:sulfur carrier protein ThiS [Paenibacillus sacheonensis]
MIINGLEQELGVLTIQEVVDHYGLTGKPVVVEADGVVLQAEQWAATSVHAAMKIELVHFVGGG